MRLSTLGFLLFTTVILTACNDGDITSTATDPGDDPTLGDPPSNETNDGLYEVGASPSQQACGTFGTTTFGANQVRISISGNTIASDWGLEGTQGVAVIEPPGGTLQGTEFHQTWIYTQTSQGFTTTYENEWDGSIANGEISSILRQDLYLQGLGFQCSLSWNVTGTKIQ